VFEILSVPRQLSMLVHICKFPCRIARRCQTGPSIVVLLAGSQMQLSRPLCKTMGEVGGKVTLVLTRKAQSGSRQINGRCRRVSKRSHRDRRGERTPWFAR
jgi:hypothetical protein